MNGKYKLLQANPIICKRLFWVDFVQLEQVLVKAQNRVDQYLRENPLFKRGIAAELNVANQLLLTFEYLRRYPAFLNLQFSYGISGNYCHKIFHKVRPILTDVIGLKNLEKLKYTHVKTVIVDVTVQLIERSKKNQEVYYNGSKKNISSSHN